MQQFKNQFKDLNYRNTISNIQSCLRLQDLDSIGDGTHCLYFDMMGLFSFRQMTIQESINFWLEFLNRLDLTPDYVTIHPDRPEWSDFYSNIEIKLDSECTWGDGDLTGYCTEFYINDIEIGNIVNPMGNCIDVGFGFQRLSQILGDSPKSSSEILLETVQKIIDSGYKPSSQKQGYILRKIIRKMIRLKIEFDHPFFESEKTKMVKSKELYQRLKFRHRDKPPEWWWDTHGIDLMEMD